MAVAAFVGSLMAALLLGPIARAFEDARVPAVISCMLFVIGAAAPCMMADKLFGVGLYALIAGFAYAMYDGTSQSLNLATLPDVRSVGRSLAAFSVANTHRLHAAGRRADDAAEVIARVHIVNLWWRGRVDALMFTA